MPEAGDLPAHLVLVGMMGSGKTTVGSRLAARLGRPFLDSDAEVERATGRSVREIFESEGEPAFRAHESRVLEAALDTPAPAVVAAAGGVVLAEANRQLLATRSHVVWLRSGVDLLAERVRSGSHRPALADDPAGTLAKMAAEREPLYRSVADAVVDVDDLTPEGVVDAVLASVEVSA